MAGATQVGWIGLGSMGIGMSKNLQKYLKSTNAPSLIYTNRTISRGIDLEALGGIPVKTVSEVAYKSDIIFSCVGIQESSSWTVIDSRKQVSNDAVLKSTVAEIIASGDIKGKTIVDCSTVHPDTSVQISADIAEAGAEFVAGVFPRRP